MPPGFDKLESFGHMNSLQNTATGVFQVLKAS